jgi:nicotinate-nucleotide--dimethylbenzimidazole phosphoribosyltransferase
VDDAGLAHKTAVVERAGARVAGVTDPLEILREVGGSELVAMAGAAQAARDRSLPLLLDGYVVTAALAPLAVARPGALDHCLAAHRSPEPGHGRLLARLGLEPLLDLELRLGEGSGALLAVPIVAMAAAAVTDVATFAEWGM